MLNKWAIYSFLILLALVNAPVHANAQGAFKELMVRNEVIGTLSGPPPPPPTGVTIVAPNYNGVLFIANSAQEVDQGDWGPYYQRANSICRRYGYRNYVTATPIEANCSPSCILTEIDSRGTPRTHKYSAYGSQNPTYLQDLTCN